MCKILIGITWHWKTLKLNISIDQNVYIIINVGIIIAKINETVKKDQTANDLICCPTISGARLLDQSEIHD